MASESEGMEDGTGRTGGDAIVATLRRHGVETLYGIPGAQTYGLFDALHRDGAVRVIAPRHEQACAYMAFGHARALGRPAVYSVVPGPGVLNTAAGLLTAAGCNEQVLCLTGQVPTAFLDRGRGHLHEMRDQRATLAGIAKWAARATTADAVSSTMAEAFRQMRSGRPGPAAVELPWDQFEARTLAPVTGRFEPLRDPEPGDALAEAAALIAASRAPMIFVGSGALDCADAVRDLAEQLDAPVVSFRSGRGIVPSSHPLGLNVAEGRHLWPAVDCVIGIGTRLEVPHWRWAPRPDVPTIRFEIDGEELARTPGVVGVHGRAATSLVALAGVGAGGRRPAWREAVTTARARAAAEVVAAPHAAFLAAIRQVLPADGILADEVCQAGFASWVAFPVETPRTFLSSGYQGTLGSGYATALGAAVARPGVPVVSITGDGGFMFGVQELATAAQHGIGAVAVLFDNGAYGNVRRDQEQRFGGRVIASELRNPDFVALAHAFGVEAATAADPAALRAALETAFTRGGPWLIVVPVTGPEPSPWPLIHGPR